MTNKEIVEKYCESNGIDDGIIIYESPAYEGALIGISYDNRAIYSYEKMVESLMLEDDISYEEAVEFIDYNTLSAFYSEKQPIIMFVLDEINC